MSTSWLNFETYSIHTIWDQAEDFFLLLFQEEFVQRSLASATLPKMQNR